MNVPDSSVVALENVRFTASVLAANGNSRFGVKHDKMQHVHVTLSSTPQCAQWCCRLLNARIRLGCLCIALACKFMETCYSCSTTVGYLCLVVVRVTCYVCDVFTTQTLNS